MDISVNGKYKQKQLATWKNEPLQFTPLINSTSVVNGMLNNVRINEEDLIDIEGEGNIVAIKSNYYSWAHEDYKEKKKKPSKKKTKKVRSLQGTGESFNSQITFLICNSHIRDNPTIVRNGESIKLRDDAHSKKAVVLKPGDEGYDENHSYEIVKKVYKVKVFRPGNISVPGVLTEDLTDVDSVLDDLTEYLSNLFTEEITLQERHTSTRNYKFMTLNGNLDILKLQNYCNNHFTGLLNTRWENIEAFIIKPKWITKNSDVSLKPHIPGDYLAIYHGYASMKYSDEVLGYTDYPETVAEKKHREEVRFSKLPHKVVDMAEFYNHLSTCNGVKNLYVDFSDLSKKILSAGLLDIHIKINSYFDNIYNKHFIVYPENIKDHIRQIVLQPLINDIRKKFNTSKNNMISHINYNPELYAGFIVRIKTPTESNPKKKTTIKLFSSGKINIDGANNREEAEFIYYWLNNTFYKNPHLLYNENEDNTESDDEFSFTEESED